MVLTEEQQTNAYPAASMETAQSTTENLYYSNINNTRFAKTSISGYPTDTYTNPNDYVAKVRGGPPPGGGAGGGLGPSIVLKVMAGDKFNVRVNSWYKTNGASPGTPQSPLGDLLAALAGGIGNISSTHGGASAAEITNSGVLTPGVTNFLYNQSYNSARPKAFVNWIFLDEQFKYYAGSVEQVGDNEEFKTHLFNDVPVNKSGYLYVYVSNETPNIDVFFDNLQVTHIRGPLLEETHYYPFGLEQAGISSKALAFGGPDNKYKYNGIEKENDFEIGIYDAQFRELDAQVGRWWQIDPVTDGYESISPYASMYNNPISISDPLGNEGENCCGGIFKAIGNAVEDVLISASGVVNGAANTLSLGLISSDPFGMRNKLGGQKLDLYNNSVTVGKVGPLLISIVSSAKTPPLELAPVNGKGPVPVSVKTQPLTPPVVPFAQQNSSDNKGGGKNAQHKNQKAKEAAQQKYEAAKENYNTLKSKANKTKEDKAAEAKAKTDMIHQKKKMDETGENHSRKAKGSN